MSSTKIEIRPFPVRGASRSEYAAVNLHNNLIRTERLPDDLPIPLEEAIQRYRHLPPIFDVWAWVGREKGRSPLTISYSMTPSENWSLR